MKPFSYYLMTPSNAHVMYHTYFFLRIGIGILTIGHGLPKLFAGPTVWHSLGSAMSIFGIGSFLTAWGFIGACVEFFGGVALVFGFMTRLASCALTCMMSIAFVMHYQKGDPFVLWSFPLSLALVFIVFMIIGGGPLSLDTWLYARLKPYLVPTLKTPSTPTNDRHTPMLD